MQCLHPPFIATPGINKFGGRKFKPRMKESFNNTNIAEYFNPFSLRLSMPASQTVTIYVYIDKMRFDVKNVGALDDLGMIYCYYRPGIRISTFCTSKYSAAVSAWSSPFMTATYRAGSTKPEYYLLYNPFQSLPSNVDNCEEYNSQVSNTAECQYDTSPSIVLSIADISPRYDSTNIYYDNLWADAGWNDSPAAVYSWLTNGSPNASELNRLTIYNDVGEFVK